MTKEEVMFEERKVKALEKIANVFGLVEYQATLIHRGIEYLNKSVDDLPIERKKFYS